MDIVRDFEESKIIVVLRDLPEEALADIAEALVRGGIRFVEVPFDQRDASSHKRTARQISMLASRFAGRLCVGAGTVCTPLQLEAACDAGARIIVAPNTDREIIARTKQLGLVSMPGAFTPSEMQAAHRAGADFIKLFPSSLLPLKAVKEMLVPLNHLKTVYFGGVTPENFASVLAAGVTGVGVAGGILERDALAQGDFDRIAARALAYTAQLGQEVEV